MFFSAMLYFSLLLYFLCCTRVYTGREGRGGGGTKMVSLSSTDVPLTVVHCEEASGTTINVGPEYNIRLC